jgi:hypothetical protein
MPKRKYTGLERAFPHPRSFKARGIPNNKRLQKTLDSHTREAQAFHRHFGKHPIHSGIARMPMLPHRRSKRW